MLGSVDINATERTFVRFWAAEHDCKCKLRFSSNICSRYKNHNKFSIHCPVGRVKWFRGYRNFAARARREMPSDLGYSSEEDQDREWNAEKQRALIKGGEQVVMVLDEMREILNGMSKTDEKSEEIAVRVAAQAAVMKYVEDLQSSFMVALDLMLAQADKDQNDEQKMLLEMIKDTVLSYLTKKMPPHVQVVGMLCRTPRKESRQELLRRVAGGGGTFDGEDGSKVVLPKANLIDIANQADDILQTLEDRRSVPDRQLLARLVIIREEARSLLQGGMLDERSHRGLTTLPNAEVAFVSKLVSMKPGPVVRERIRSVMMGYEEGADIIQEQSKDAASTSKSSTKGHPVRPGMFLETVTKVIGGIYEAKIAGVTVQQLDWVHRETLNILQEIAFS